MRLNFRSNPGWTTISTAPISHGNLVSGYIPTQLRYLYTLSECLFFSVKLTIPPGIEHDSTESLSLSCDGILGTILSDRLPRRSDNKLLNLKQKYLDLTSSTFDLGVSHKASATFPTAFASSKTNKNPRCLVFFPCFRCPANKNFHHQGSAPPCATLGPPDRQQEL